jgi:HD-GYP domain-containing protein (c-di-GMP phosphodiesterase class II)
MSSWKTFLDIDHLHEFAKLFGRVIDFRSSFTAIHSSRVSRIASSLAAHAGMSAEECRLIGISGLLHDLGKLAVPSEVLEKPSPLSDSEWNVMRRHSFHTYELLSGIEGFETITRWAANHHERLDGNGYPFHYKENEITCGERIVAISDIFTALTEDRPYRGGLDPVDALSIMKGMVKRNALDAYIVEKLSENADELNRIRVEAENEIIAEYNDFIKGV